MAIINNSKNSRNVAGYGAPIFDEAKLRELFSKIGSLDTQSAAEGATAKQSAAKLVLLAEIQGYKSIVTTYSAEARIIASAANKSLDPAINRGERVSEGVRPIEANYQGSRLANYLDPMNAAIQKSSELFIRLLGKGGFASSTITAAENAMAVVLKYSFLKGTYRRVTTYVARSVNEEVSLEAGIDSFPETSLVAREILVTLNSMMWGISDSDYYEAFYPALPNPFLSNYTEKFELYFSTNYKP